MTTVQEPTIKDVYQLTLSLAQSMEVLTKKVTQLETRMDKLEQRVDELYDILHRFASDTEKRFVSIERTMVTKDYFDHRLDTGLL